MSINTRFTIHLAENCEVNLLNRHSLIIAGDPCYETANQIVYQLFDRNSVMDVSFVSYLNDRALVDIPNRYLYMGGNCYINDLKREIINRKRCLDENHLFGFIDRTNRYNRLLMNPIVVFIDGYNVSRQDIHTLIMDGEKVGIIVIYLCTEDQLRNMDREFLVGFNPIVLSRHDGRQMIYQTINFRYRFDVGGDGTGIITEERY